MIVSTTSAPTNCNLPDCPRLGMIHLLRQAAGDPPFQICTHHYHKLISRMREHGMTEDDIQRLTNQEVITLAIGTEFTQLIARLVADERFKAVIRKAKKRAAQTPQEK